jgi:hypothetical protein
VFVEDHESLQPGPGVRLEVIGGPDAGKSATTGWDGAFALGGLAPGTVALRATKRGYRPADLRLTVEPGDVHTDVLMDTPIRPDHRSRTAAALRSLAATSDAVFVSVRSSDDPSAD